MSRSELYLVLEALKAAETELNALIDDDSHYPSGKLMEQIEEAIVLVQDKYDHAE